MRFSILVVAFAWGGPLEANQAAIQAATYHLDCASGADSREGTSPETAWKSLVKASTALLNPGDRLLLKRGCSWTGPLRAGWAGTAAAPIEVATYGTGKEPEIRDGNSANVELNGRYIVVESLTVSSAPVIKDAGCRDQPVGWRSGFTFPSGSHHNTLRAVTASGHSMGVYMATGSHSNRVLNSVIKDNVSLSVNDKANPDNDAGAFGILVNGDSNEIAFNTFANNLAWCSYDYGIDGSSVEIYNGKGNRIHHNRALGEGTFTELGGSRTADNVFAYNLVVSEVEECIFLNVRGGAGKWGPNLDTRVFNNTVYLTGAKSQGVVCTEGCSPAILQLHNNIFWVGWKGAYVDAQPAAGHNLFWKSGGSPLIQNLTLDSASRIADPRFADAASGDFRLQPSSPGLDRGTSVPPATGSGLGTDLAGIAVPSGKGPEIGAYETSTGVWSRSHGKATLSRVRRSREPPGPGPAWLFQEPGAPGNRRDLAGKKRRAISRF